ncbi:hypothetical protein AWB81_08573 [Caballeronia arationis]|nr:hypothetical protein AWB81_08573 [Caballeronia arationis]
MPCWSMIVSSMPQRGCRPIDIAIMLNGSTFFKSDSAVSVQPSGARCTKLKKLNGFGPSKPPPMPIHVRFSGPVYTPLRTRRSSVSSAWMPVSWKWGWIFDACSRLRCSSTHAGPAGTVISLYAA